MNLLIELLLKSVEKRPDSIFLSDIESGKSFSYRDLFIATKDMQAFLSAHQVSAGMRVAYVTRSNYFFYPLFFACAGLGAALVPINIENNHAEINAIINDAEPKLVFYDQAPKEDAGHPKLPASWVLVCNSDCRFMIPREFIARHREFKANNCAFDTRALIIYTSGTTGSSKGVVLTPHNLCSMANTLATVYKYSLGQRFLCILPLFHINAIVLTGLACIVNNSCVIHSRPFDFTMAKFYWKIIKKHRVNVLSITPSIMAVLMKLFPFGADYKVPFVKHALVGTAHLEENIWRSFEQRFSIPCYQGYGLTETTTWATMTPPGTRKRYNTAGIPIGCKVKINKLIGPLNDPSGAGQKGEIMISGDIVFKEYYHNVKLTRGTLQNGWLKTGDIGYFDPEGQLVVTGRIKNIIKRKGDIIFPEEVDKLLRVHDNIIDSCTFGIKDDLLGERVISACVVKSEEKDTDNSLRGFILGRLSMYKCPDGFIFLKKLPKNPVGKVRIGELRDIATGKKCDEVIQAFNTQKIKRANPSDADMITMRRIIHTAICAEKPFYFVGYWGVGRRHFVTDEDRKALSRLDGIIKPINGLLGNPLAKIKLVLNDVHGRCNNVPEETIKEYFSGIKNEAKHYGFEYEPLSSIWKKHSLDYDSLMQKVYDPEFIRCWNNFSLKADFLSQAYRRCSDDKISQEFAQRYYAICCYEKSAITEYFQGDIFFTYSSPKFRAILPDLPKVYWYSVKKGTSERPWFM